MASTSKYIECKVHGSGVANCSSYPKITAKFTITFSRNPGNQKVTWSTSGMGNWGHNTQGKYGYKFHAYINVNGSGYKSIISKENTYGDEWWKHTTTSNQSGSFNTTSNTATVAIYVKRKHTCKHSDKWCFGGKGTYYKVATYTVNLPQYGVYITYDGNGEGVVNVPEKQLITTFPSNISSTVPKYPLTISFYNNLADPTTVSNTKTTYRQFNNWLSNPGSTTYNPGDPYNVQSNCTMIAQWGNAQFVPDAMPNKKITLTFDAMGGTVEPTSKDIYFTKLGYSTTPDGTTYPYQPGVTAYTTTNLDLYPKFSPRQVALSELPTPVWAGHAFEGWYYNRDRKPEHRVTNQFTPTTDMILYANWIPLPVNVFTPNGDWDSTGRYVWQMVNGSWVQVAPIYKFKNNKWVNISELEE